MKILADANMAGVREIFAPLGEVELFEGRGLSTDQLAGVDVLLIRSVTRVDDDLLGEHSPAFIGTATSGFDHVERAVLEARGIPFAWAPGSNADSVVDYVLSALCHHPQRLAGLLAGEPLGIVGYGHIGRCLHRRLERLGIHCLAYDPWLDAARYPALSTLEEVLACPVLCLHAALTDAQPWPSRHMLDVQLLQQLPESALLLNAGRGELLATKVLLELHDARRDISLVLDVWENEPSVDARLLEAARFGTAHIAGYSYDGKLRATQMLYSAACDALGREAAAGGELLPPVELEIDTGLGRDELVCRLVAAVYDVAEDDSALRNAMPDGFDGLRKQYRQRRELSAVQVVNGAELDPAARETCEALGCSAC